MKFVQVLLVIILLGVMWLVWPPLTFGLLAVLLMLYILLKVVAKGGENDLKTLIKRMDITIGARKKPAVDPSLPKHSEPSNKKDNGYKVLFVDDDPLLQEINTKKFQEKGFQVVALTDAGGDFVGKVDKIKPDIIIMDIVLPRRDGYEAIKLLKSDDKTKDIPVIFLTNMGQREEVKKGLSLGAMDYIIMAHHTPEELVKRISQHLHENH